ncbi:protein TFG-like [Tigriopus californicus]|uniref:protein TFG-like n=1 Tax=Tigriopus californicus TaxID=6832 RepID=UPI0027DA1C46|nr:protein TFG-like [Tigriopus californicus]
MDLTGKLIIKATLGEDIRRIPIHNEELTYDELILMMQRVFRGQLSSTDDITLKYKDEDGDLITIFDSADVSFAVQYSRVLKLTLFVNGLVPKSASRAFTITNDIKEELRNIRDRVVRVLDALDDSRGGEDTPDGEADVSAQVQSQLNINGKMESREFDPLQKQQQQQSSQGSEQIRPSATPPVPPTTPVAPYQADANHQNRQSYPNPETDASGASGQTYPTPSSMASGVSSPYVHSQQQQQPAVSSGGFNPAYPQVQSVQSAYPGAQPSPGAPNMVPRPPMSSSGGSIPPQMSLPSQAGAPSGGGFQPQGAMGAYRPPASSQPQPGYGYQGGQAPRPMYPPQSMASQTGGVVNHQPQQQQQQHQQQQQPQASAEGAWQGYRAPMSGAGPVGPGGAPPVRPPVAGSASPMNPYAKGPTQGGYAHAAPAPGYR